MWLVTEVRSSSVGKIWFEISLDCNFLFKWIKPWKAQAFAALNYVNVAEEKTLIFSKGFKTYLPLYFIHLMYFKYSLLLF